MNHLAIAVAGGLLLAGPALAECTIGERMERQEKRIDQGDARDQLTPKEERRLEHQQDVIEDKREDARDDGRVTRSEREELRRAQDRAGDMIRRKRHNDEDSRQ